MCVMQPDWAAHLGGGGRPSPRIIVSDPDYDRLHLYSAHQRSARTDSLIAGPFAPWFSWIRPPLFLKRVSALSGTSLHLGRPFTPPWQNRHHRDAPTVGVSA